MAILSYLSTNLRWQFKQNPFDNLVCQPTGQKELVKQLHALSEKYFPDRQHINTYTTEFCLNKIALSAPKTETERMLKEHFARKWAAFARLKKLFARNYMLFPSNADGTRLEQIAELVTKCTQFCLSDIQMQEIQNEILCAFDLSPREKQYLSEVIDLYAIDHFCALYSTLCSTQVAKVLQNDLLKFDYATNDKYRQAVYRKGKLSTVLNCLGNSALSYGQKNLAYKQNIYVYCNGRNVFDTFTQSKLGRQTAEFCATTNTLVVDMQYFLTEFSQVKRFRMTNTGKSTKKYTVDITLDGGEQMFIGDQYAVVDNDVYVATAVVCDNQIVQCETGQGVLTFCPTCKPQQTICFDVVTIASHNADIVAREVGLLNTFGRTRCDVLSDCPAVETTSSAPIVGLTSYGYGQRKVKGKPATTMHYSYRLGNDDVGTFADNDGNQTTVLTGFAFGKGEQVYCVSGGKLCQLNCGKFVVDGQTLTYEHDFGSCGISHGVGKKYTITYAKPCRTLFYFPLESGGTVTKLGNKFVFASELRRFEIVCDGKIDSYTTNALECNAQRLRYKLSNNLSAGTCIAVCFAPSCSVELTVTNCAHVPLPSPILRESLVSTYLNYVNGKNVFCLANMLAKPCALSLAAICYTNPDFVRTYLQRLSSTDSQPLFYDDKCRLVPVDDPLMYPLAALYYATIVDGSYLSTTDRDKIQTLLLTAHCEGKVMAIKALALKKAAMLGGFDKMKLMVEYADLKRTICADPTIYAYAQAIGAVPLVNPSKQRLKDICQKLDVPQAWYYVSQIENLYGMVYADGKLSFTPKVSQDNVLEEIAVTVGGRRICTTFARSNVQSMTLNGVTHFQPFYPSKLVNIDNTLIVNY